MNITKNWPFIKKSFKVTPVIVDHQKVTPAKIAKTAPMDST